MRKIILTVLMISISTFVSAAYKDVIKMELIEGCSADELVEITIIALKFGRQFFLTKLQVMFTGLEQRQI
jgi:hypothetical protein